MGPPAGKPVMEGKGCLFKKSADIELAEKDPDSLIDIIAALARTLLRQDHTIIAAMMVRLGRADGMICGTSGGFLQHLRSVESWPCPTSMPPTSPSSCNGEERACPLFPVQRSQRRQASKPTTRPASSRLRNSRLAPCSSAMRRTIVRPRPLPSAVVPEPR